MDNQILFNIEHNSSEKSPGTSSIVRMLKDNGEDFEWYPTTQEIVDCLAKHIVREEKGNYDNRLTLDLHGNNNHGSAVLDIGCGNGGFFEKLDKTKAGSLIRTRYGIEKSFKLYELLPKDNVTLLGTDFMEQTLIDKKVDLIFSNPPYSIWEDWTEKIIREGNCCAMALVIPVRWKNSEKIKELLNKRHLQAEILGTFNFENAERQARATVDLVYLSAAKIENSRYGYYDCYQAITDPFDIWFDETFSINCDKDEKHLDYEEINKRKNEILNMGGDLVENLLAMYSSDIEKIQRSYKALENLDPDIFSELHVNIEGLKKSLRKRLEGLKSFYWNMLFDRYKEITKRLTQNYREKVLIRLNNNVTIDFTRGNIYQMTLWLIEHANDVLDEQLKDFFYSLCNSDSIKNYKSNKRWNDDNWIYIKEHMTKEGYARKYRNPDYIHTLKNIALDYRIVCESYHNFEGYNGDTLSNDCFNFLNDIQIMAANLGFNIISCLPDNRYNINTEFYSNFNIMMTDGKEFANVKLYKNGNRHIKFCKSFMQRLNVEMARINGWVRDKREASEEIGLSDEDANNAWGSNKKFDLTSGCKLIGCNSISIA